MLIFFVSGVLNRVTALTVVCLVNILAEYWIDEILDEDILMLPSASENVQKTER